MSTVPVEVFNLTVIVATLLICLAGWIGYRMGADK